MIVHLTVRAPSKNTGARRTLQTLTFSHASEAWEWMEKNCPCEVVKIEYK